MGKPAAGEVTWGEATARAYRRFIDPIRDIARTHGYAIGVHGSVRRDIDLIACPWRADAASPAALVESIRSLVGGYIRNDPWDEDGDPNDETRRNPVQRPHGRQAWSIHLGGGPYIDLSVMPRLAAEPAAGEGL